MSVRVRGEQLASPFYVDGDNVSISGTMSVVFSTGTTKFISGSNESEPNFGILLLNDASVVSPVPPDVPATLYLIPDTGFGMIGTFTSGVSSVVSIFGAGLGNPSMDVSVDDANSSNTFKNALFATSDQIKVGATNLSNSEEHVFIGKIGEGCKLLSPLRVTISGGSIGVAIDSGNDVVISAADSFYASGNTATIGSGSNVVSATSSGTNVAGTLYILDGFTAYSTCTINGHLTINGNVDGRDVSADGATLDSHVANTTTAHGATSANTASAFVVRDSNKNFQVNHVQQAVTTTVTSGSTDNFSVTSSPIRVYSGSSNQGVNLPNATTLVVGHQFQIINTGTGTISIRDAAGSTVFTLGTYNSVRLTCTNISSSAGTWSVGTSSVSSHTNYQSYVPFFTVYDNGNSGNSKTIDWNNGTKQKLTLTPTANCVLSFTAPPGAAGLTLEVIQNGTGSKTVTWPASVYHPGGVAPTLTTTASGTDIFSFQYNGTNYMMTSALDMRAS